MSRAIVFASGAAILLFLAIALNGRAAMQQPARSANSQAEKLNSRERAIRLNNIGAAYMNQQSFEKALQSFQQAYAVDPQLSTIRLNQGIAYLYRQETDKALPIFQEAVKNDPGNARAWYNLGLLYRTSGDFTSAAAAFRKVTELAPKDADAFYFLGASCSQAGNNPCAIEAFQHALQLNPYHASAEFGLARAYQKTGEAQQARAHLSRFQHLTQTKLGAPITLNYGEQGALSLTETVGPVALTAGPPISVEFTDATASAGLSGKPAAVDSKSKLTGAGACEFDLDGDGNPDLFLTGFGPAGGVGLYRNLGGGKFADVTRDAGLAGEGPAISCAAADYDNDGRSDLAIGYPGHVALYHNEGQGKFRDISQQAGLSNKTSGASFLWVDYDHDGDVDLYVVDAASGGQLWRNNGNGTFSDVTAETALTFPDAATAGLASDVNNDRAVDLLITRRSGPPLLFTNPREGKWASSGPWPASLTGAVSITALDFNKDGWMDFALATESAPGLVLLRSVQGRSFEEVKMPPTGWSRGVSVVTLDYDNDGFVDLAAAGIDKNGNPAIRVFRNTGSGSFEDATMALGLNNLNFASEPYLTTADFDGDGDSDLLVNQPGAAPLLLRNDGGNRNNSLRISLKGLVDNKDGIGTKVEVFAGDLWQKWEIHEGGGPGQSSGVILAGIGKRTQADVVRLLWPTGVIQDEVSLPASKPQQITEIDRRGSSCPVLFAWDGTRYRFISDMIGAGVVGHWVGPGERNVPDPTEYLKVSGSILKERNGRLSFRFMEPMEEVVYLDQVRLLAVDHPQEYSVNPNEYFASSPPFPDFKVIASRQSDIRPPAGAWDGHGRDARKELSHVDHDYVSRFHLLHFSGYAEPHLLELDLGTPYEGGTLRLLMRGFIEYFTATSMYAAHQAGIDPVAPYVEAQNARGKWVRVIDDMGFPAGLPRSMIADLTGKLPRGARRIRIGTNLQIYWDQILIDRTPASGPIRITEAPLSSAELKFHGYPRDVERRTNARGDHYYVYEQVSSTGPYVRQAGNYTRLGNVMPLLSQVDDRFAIFGSGDAISLEFDPRQLPPLPSGWVRDYFFFADGYEKDMDFYASEGLTVGPLPYKEMHSYPYTQVEDFLSLKSSVDYILDYNTRVFSGRSRGVRSRYRFQDGE
jgi:tetratricopeptide (TPR) repeat protein